MTDTKALKPPSKQSWTSLAIELGYQGKHCYAALKKDCKTIAKQLEKISGSEFINIRGLTPKMVQIIKDHLGFE